MAPAHEALGGRRSDEARTDDQDPHRDCSISLQAGTHGDQLLDSLGAEELLRQLVHRVQGVAVRAHLVVALPERGTLRDRDGLRLADPAEPGVDPLAHRRSEHLDDVVAVRVCHVGVRDRRVERPHVGAVTDRPGEPFVTAQCEPRLVLGGVVPLEVGEVGHDVAPGHQVAEVEDVGNCPEDDHQVRHVDVRPQPDLEVHVQDRRLAVADPGVDQPLDTLVRVPDVGVERALVAAVLGGPVVEPGAGRVRLDLELGGYLGLRLAEDLPERGPELGAVDVGVRLRGTRGWSWSASYCSHLGVYRYMIYSDRRLR